MQVGVYGSRNMPVVLVRFLLQPEKWREEFCAVGSKIRKHSATSDFKSFSKITCLANFFHTQRDNFGRLSVRAFTLSDELCHQILFSRQMNSFIIKLDPSKVR